VAVQVELRGPDGGALGAGRPEPAQLAVALLARRRGGADVDAPAPVPTVGVVDALVPVLAAGPVVETVASALGEELAAVAGAVLFEGATRLDVHVRARPEAVGAGPLVGLPQEAQGAVGARVVRRELHQVRLRPGNKQDLFPV